MHPAQYTCLHGAVSQYFPTLVVFILSPHTTQESVSTVGSGLVEAWAFLELEGRDGGAERVTRNMLLDLRLRKLPCQLFFLPHLYLIKAL